MKSWFLLSLLFLASVASAACNESVVWVPGHWSRSGCSDVWVSGYYRRTVTYTHMQEVWVAGRWVQSECGWSYEPGHYETQTVCATEPAPCVRETVIVTQQACPPVYEPVCRERRSRSHVSFGVAVGVPVPVPVPAPRLRALPVPVPVPFGHSPRLPKLPKLPPLPDPIKLFKKL